MLSFAYDCLLKHNWSLKRSPIGLDSETPLNISPSDIPLLLIVVYWLKKCWFNELVIYSLINKTLSNGSRHFCSWLVHFIIWKDCPSWFCQSVQPPISRSAIKPIQCANNTFACHCMLATLINNKCTNVSWHPALCRASFDDAFVSVQPWVRTHHYLFNLFQ